MKQFLPALSQSFRMLRRDLRAGELGLLLVALVIAVASLTSVGFFTDRVAQALGREANQLLGGDLVLVSDHALDPAYRAEASRLGRPGQGHGRTPAPGRHPEVDWPHARGPARPGR